MQEANHFPVFPSPSSAIHSLAMHRFRLITRPIAHGHDTNYAISRAVASRAEQLLQKQSHPCAFHFNFPSTFIFCPERKSEARTLLARTLESTCLHRKFEKF